jgi:hypothetical protein
MHRAVVLILASTAILALCVACQPATDTFKVSGTVTGLTWTITGNAAITVTGGGQTYSLSVPASGSSSPFASYAVPGVPKGTYTLTVTFTESNVAPPAGPQTLYTINGGASATVTMDSTTGLGPYVWTVELDNVSISADTVIDFDLGCGGC